VNIDDYNPMSPNELDTAIRVAQDVLRSLNNQVAASTYELSLMFQAYRRKIVAPPKLAD